MGPFSSVFAESPTKRKAGILKRMDDMDDVSHKKIARVSPGKSNESIGDWSLDRTISQFSKLDGISCASVRSSRSTKSETQSFMSTPSHRLRPCDDRKRKL